MRRTRCNEGLVWDEPRWHREHYKVVTDFGAVGDSAADDTASIQAAIDHHAGSRGDKHAGIVFFPAGTYRITQPLLLWKGTQLLCHPEQKAMLVLPPQTAGYDDPDDPRPMLQLTCGTDQDVNDHTHHRQGHGSLNWVFHTALRNLDFVVEAGNPGAVVAWWWADHDVSVEHAHLLLKSGKAGIWMPDDSGRVHLYKCRFEGGDYGFYVGEYSQNSIVACHFSGQRQYSVAVHSSLPPTLIKDCAFSDSESFLLADSPGGMMLLNNTFTSPKGGAAVERPSGTLLMLNNRFADCQWAVRDELEGKSGGEVAIFSYVQGRICRNGETAEPGIFPEVIDTQGPDYSLADIFADEDCPGNVCLFGAVGDGAQDDSEAIQKAIDTEEVVYLPMGTYRLEETVRLKRNTKLIGTHRSEVKLYGPDGKAALETPDDPDAEVLIKELQVHSGAADGVGIDWRCGGRSALFMVNTWTEPGGYTAFLARQNAGGTYLFGWGGGFQGKRNHGKVFTDMKGPMHIYGVDSEHSEYAPYLLRNVQNLLMVNWQTEAQPKIQASVWCEECKNIALLGGLAGARTGPLAVRLVNCKDVLLSNISISAWVMDELVHETRADGTEVRIPAEPEKQNVPTLYLSKE